MSNFRRMLAQEFEPTIDWRALLVLRAFLARDLHRISDLAFGAVVGRALPPRGKPK